MNSSLFISELQTLAKRSFIYGDALALLVDQAVADGKLDVLRDAAFHAKFIAKTTEVMERIGPNGDGVERLGAELESSIETVRADCLVLLASAGSNERASFESRFLAVEPGSFTAFIALMRELAWVKNWELDGRTIPEGTGVEPGPDGAERVTLPRAFRHSDLDHMFRSAVLGLALLVTYIFVEPPVSIIGAVLAGLAVVQFGTVSYFLYKMRRSDAANER